MFERPSAEIDQKIINFNISNSSITMGPNVVVKVITFISFSFSEQPVIHKKLIKNKINLDKDVGCFTFLLNSFA